MTGVRSKKAEMSISREKLAGNNVLNKIASTVDAIMFKTLFPNTRNSFFSG